MKVKAKQDVRSPPYQAIKLVRCCKVSLVLSPPSSHPSLCHQTIHVEKAFFRKLTQFPSTNVLSAFSPHNATHQKALPLLVKAKQNKTEIHSFTHSWNSTHTSLNCGTEPTFFSPQPPWVFFEIARKCERNFQTTRTRIFHLFSTNFLLRRGVGMGWVAFESG